MKKLMATVACLAALSSFTPALASPPKGGGPVGDPVGDPTDPGTGDPGDGGDSGSGNGGASGSSAINPLPAGPIGTTTYQTVFNGVVQGGVLTAQSSPFSEIGQVFTSPGGTLDQLTFMDSNSTAAGTQLNIVAVNPMTYASVGSVSSETFNLTIGAGDKQGVGGLDGYYYHTFSPSLSLSPNQSYYAYLTETPGSNVFNGNTTLFPSKAYFFGTATSGSPLGGELVIDNSNGIRTALAGAPAALFSMSFTPSAIVSPAPEPASWMTMILGFCLIGGVMRYARRTRVGLSRI